MSRVKDRARLDLLAKIGRGVYQEPALAVAAHGERGLRSGHGPGVAGPRKATRFGVGVPLRETATGSGPQNDGLHGDRRGLSRAATAALIRGRQKRRS